MRAVVAMIVCASAAAWAKPKVAVVPLANDLPDDKLSAEIADALRDDFAVVSFKALARVTQKTTVDDDLAAKIEKQTSAQAVIHGKVVKTGAKRSLHLKISVKGQDTAELVVKLKGSSLDDDGKAKIHDEVGKDLARKKRHRKRGDDDEPEAKRATQDLFVDAGAAFGVRRLTYESTGAKRPPTVGTAAPSARVEASLYFKAAGATGPLGNLGVAGEYDIALGLSIPLGTMNVPIDQGHYAVGVRYRLDAGDASVVVLGADYAARHYIADRSKLTPGTPLDAPDTDYQGAQVDLGGRTPLAPAITGFATLSAMLPFQAGGIQKTDSYGPANVYGVGLAAGVDIAVASQIAVHIAGEAEQIGLSFKGTGNLAQARMVTAATDRQLGLVATLALVY